MPDPDRTSASSSPCPADTTLTTLTPAAGVGALYVVATPIGNLSDLGQRASDTLRAVRWVAAEDTRVSRVLLDRIGATARMMAVHQHNEARAADAIIERLREGDKVALISDAGTPAISDPGSAIVAAAHAAGVPVVPIPGASAPVTLLSASGLPPSPFLFEGFLPPKDKARDERLRELRRHADAIGAHLVLFEAPHRIERTLAAIASSHGASRLLVIGRELTKKFEQIVRIEAGRALDWLAESPDHRRGEFAIAIAAQPRESTKAALDGGGDRPPTAADPADSGGDAAGLDSEILDWPASAHRLNTPRALLERLLRDLPASRAVKLAEELTGQPHKALYALALSMKKEES